MADRESSPGTVAVMCGPRCVPDTYWADRFADEGTDQERAIATAAKCGDVYCTDQLNVLLGHPNLTVDHLAHIALRLAQPPGIFTRAKFQIGYLVPGKHPLPLAALSRHSRVADVIVALAPTWDGTDRDLATVATAVVAAHPAG